MSYSPAEASKCGQFTGNVYSYSRSEGANCEAEATVSVMRIGNLTAAAIPWDARKYYRNCL